MAKEIKRIGLRDIAQKAGVTVPTVSRILSEQTDNFSVRPEVRERVLAAVKQLNYRPNILAQSLRKTKMGIVGLLSVQSALPYFQDIVNGLMEAFQDKNITLCSTYSSIPHPVQSLPPWRIDGAIIVSSVASSETDRLEAARIPYVCINGVAGPSAMLVSMDDVNGTRVATEYLLRIGHRRIAYANVTGPFKTHASVDTRYSTFVEVLGEAGLKPIMGPELTDESVYDEYVRATVLDRKATALVAYHSYQAVYLSRAAQRLGLQIPRDVSLLSLSGGYPLEVLYPSVTSVYLPFREAGIVAGQMLVRALVSGKPSKPDVVIPETFTIRQSTAPPKA